VPPPSTTYGSAALGTQGTSPGNARYDDEDPYKFDDAAVRAKFAESKVISLSIGQQAKTK